MFKTTIKILGVILVLGLIFMVIAMSFGGKATMFFTFGKDIPKERISEVQHGMEEFDTIKADSTISNIKIFVSDEYAFEAQNMYGTEIAWDVKDGIFTISENVKPNFNLASVDIYENQENYIIIWVPREKKIENINVQTVSGDIVLNEITGNYSEFKLVSGDLDMESCVIDELNVSATSGDVDIDKSQINKSNTNLKSGDVSMEDVRSEEIKGSCISGDFEVNGEIGKLADISNVSGNVYIQVKGNEEDYSLDLSGVSSYITIDNNQFEDKVDIKKGDKLIRINNTSGSIGVRFI